ncbi:MAG: two-component system sensor histidine kinase CreC [Nitrospiraceae bacterium]|nr:two-component system sensor histidine kinase CreC [Nitrospiraceae bacterium]
MKIRTRIFAAFLVLVGLGFYALVDWILDDLRPRYLATMEESMVDTANILASALEEDVRGREIHTDDLRAVFGVVQRRELAAKIYEVMKTRVNLRVYVVDRQGVVLFDSDGGRAEGEDYSRWNDVYRTLRGEYGARATLLDPNDPFSDVLYVAAPIKAGDEIVGALTVCKPTDNVTLFLKTARKKIASAGLFAALAVVALGMIVSSLITWPIEALTAYAKAIRDGKRTQPPNLGRSEMGALGEAFEEMRTALEGKQYVEDYVQALTHQMKSPLSAIQGASELLDEDMPPEQRRRFLENLRSESQRIRDIVDRMLQLSALENRRKLRDVEDVDLAALLAKSVESVRPVAAGKRVAIQLQHAAPIVVKCERFLVRQAVMNLLQNALDFSEPESTITVSFEQTDGEIEIRVRDTGPGIPDYALDQVFDRFYSLPRPGSGMKSSGLGLAFVREVAALHGGRATIENHAEGGAVATLTLPA